MFFFDPLLVGRSLITRFAASIWHSEHTGSMYVPDGKSMIFFSYVARRQYAHSHGPVNAREMQIPIKGCYVVSFSICILSANLKCALY